MPTPAANALHATVHAVPVPVAVAAGALHANVHVPAASRIVVGVLHGRLHLGTVRSPVQVRAVHCRVHVPAASPAVHPGAPFTYPGGFPAPHVPDRKLEYHLLGRDGHDFGTLTKDRNRNFQHILNDVGSGRAEVRFNEPLADELTIGRILSAYVDGHGPVFDFLLEPGQRNTLTQDEATGEGRIVGGRGTLAVFSESRIGPQRLTGAPIEHVIVFNYCHPAYDASAWIPATEIADQGNNPSVLWKGKPAQWTVPQAVWIWSSDGTQADAPAPKTRWFRHEFTIDPGKYSLQTAGDNAYQFDRNGSPVVTAGDLLKTTGAFWRSIRTPLDIDAGPQIFGIKGQNYTATVPGANPAGMLAALTKVDTDGIEISTMFYTNSTWTTFPDLSDGAFPGVTVGMAMIWLIEQAQLAGGLEHVMWDFDAVNDSNGNPWPLIETLTANVGEELLTAWRTFVQSGLCDLRMAPGSPLKFQAYRYGEMIPVSTAVFDSGFADLSYADPPTVVNAYLVQYDSGFFWIDDPASVAEHGRIEGYLSMGNSTAEEALSRASAELAVTKDPNRAQITVSLAHGDPRRPYETFGVGSVVSTRQEDGSMADERVTSISVADDGDEIAVIPTLRDRILEDEDRIDQWLATFGNGASSGIFQGASKPPTVSIPLTNPANEGEIIHLQGAVVLTPPPTPRYPIMRTGTARLFFVFLSGQLDTANIDVTCYINDVAIVSTTIDAGERRSPLVAFDPPERVTEFDDWWSFAVTDAGTGAATELTGHLIVS